MTIETTTERYKQCRALNTGYLNQLWPSDGQRPHSEDERLFFIADTLIELEKSLAGRDNAKDIAEAAVILARRFEALPAEERLRVAVRINPKAFLQYIGELAERAERDDWISSYDLEVGEALAAIKTL